MTEPEDRPSASCLAAVLGLLAVGSAGSLYLTSLRSQFELNSTRISSLNSSHFSPMKSISSSDVTTQLWNLGLSESLSNEYRKLKLLKNDITS